MYLYNSIKKDQFLQGIRQRICNRSDVRYLEHKLTVSIEDIGVVTGEI